MADQHADISVSGMTCQKCENIVRKAVGEIGGVDKVDVSAHDNLVSVDYNPEKVSIDDIKDAINNKGYEAE